jgi:pectate lyase
MKISNFSVGLAILLPLVVAAPTPTEEKVAQHAAIVKRATITDIADTGYATQNGG